MAGKIPRHFIDEVLSRNDIVDVIEGFIPIKKAGKNYSACCPFHNEKTPSFSISPEKQFYHCFGCGAHGNAISFLMEHDKQDFVTAIKSLAERAGLPMPVTGVVTEEDKRRQQWAETMKKAASYYASQLSQPKAEGARAYLANRGVSKAMQSQFNLGFAPPGWDNLLKTLPAEGMNDWVSLGLIVQNDKGRTYDRFRDRLMFPIRNRKGLVIGFGGRVIGEGNPKYLNSPETPLFHKGRELYGLYEALQVNRNPDYILVVEGYMDVLALAQHQVTSAVATLGTAATEHHLESLLRYTSKVVFCFDGDDAGRKAAWRALQVVLPKLKAGLSVYFMFLPQGEDPDTFIRTSGRAAFEDAVAQAKSVSQVIVEHLAAKQGTGTVEEKAKVLEAAKPYLEQIQDPLVKTLLLEALSQAAAIPIERLQKAIQVGQTTVSSPEEPYGRFERRPRRQVSLETQTPMRVAIALILQTPSLVNMLDKNAIESLMALELPGSQLLKSILEYLSKHPEHSTGHLLEQWRGTQEASILSQLASWQYVTPEEGLEAELKGVIQRLLSQQKDKVLEALLEKSRYQNLTTVEKSKLKTLLSERGQ